MRFLSPYERKKYKEQFSEMLAEFVEKGNLFFMGELKYSDFFCRYISFIGIKFNLTYNVYDQDIHCFGTLMEMTSYEEEV